MIGDRIRLTFLASVPVSLMTALCPCVDVIVTLAAASAMEVTPPNMLSIALVLALTGRSQVPTSAPRMGTDRQEFTVVGSTIGLPSNLPLTHHPKYSICPIVRTEEIQMPKAL